MRKAPAGRGNGIMGLLMLLSESCAQLMLLSTAWSRCSRCSLVGSALLYWWAGGCLESCYARAVGSDRMLCRTAGAFAFNDSGWWCAVFGVPVDAARPAMPRYVGKIEKAEDWAKRLRQRLN